MRRFNRFSDGSAVLAPNALPVFWGRLGAFRPLLGGLLRERFGPLALSCQSKLGVFLRDNGLMYFANVALDRCPVWSMMMCVATPRLVASVQ